MVKVNKSHTKIKAQQFFGAALDKVPSIFLKKILGSLSINYHLQDKLGFYIRPIHFYDPLPDFSKITKEKILQRRVSPCIEWRIESMLEMLEKIASFKDEVVQLEFSQGFGGLDGASYYAMIRYLKPSKVIEIGSGGSTIIASLAMTKNQQEGVPGKIICIEPYPRPILKDDSLNIELIIEKAENVNTSFFEQLGAGDILFIDSTHTVKFNSDVCKEILEILPTLSSGSYIHFHDIFIPYDYPPVFLIDRRIGWNEQYMLEAFLAYNSAFEVVLANHWLSVDYPEKVAELFPEVLNWETPYHRCGSFWMHKK
jgi:hypothetical protein